MIDMITGYYVGFRHTGQKEPGEGWWSWNTMRIHLITLRQLKRLAMKHQVTHVVIGVKIPPDLHKVFPHISHLCMIQLWKIRSSDLEW